MSSRDVDEQILHDHIIQVLRKEMYNYPNPAHPNLITYINHPTKTKAVFTPERKEMHPDIVVIDQRTTHLVLVAEVETESTVVPEEQPEWADFQQLKTKLHIHFPKGFGPVMTGLCQGFHNTELYQYSKVGKSYLVEKVADLA
ncbi:MAG: hypothetical protein ABIK86_02505 [candidate division WOR-3 bacterium]